MELRQLRYFLVLAEELHFGRAAAKLNITQPPLTRQIKALERELEVRLLRRNSQSVELTAAGKAFLEECRQILERVAASVRVAQRAERGEIGRLAIAFEGSSAYDIVPQTIKTYRERYPGVELVVLGMTTKEQVIALQEKQIDLGFIVPPLRGKEPELIVEPILQEPLILALSATHRLATQSQISVRSLANELFVMAQRNSGCGLYDQVIAVCQEAGFVPKVIQEVNEMQIMLGFVAAKLGIAILSASARQFSRPGVVYRELTPSVREVALAIVWSQGNHSSTLPVFLEVVRELSLLNS